MHIDTSLLKGRHVYLEELQQGHISQLRILAKDKRLWEYTRTLVINESYDEQFDRYIAIAQSPNSEGTYGVGLQKSFVIYSQPEGKMIGMTRYYAISEMHKRLDIGYTWYIPEVWGRVHNKECKFLLLQYAFETLRFNRVGFHVAHVNLRSQKAVEKIGGRKEGVLRKHSYQTDGSIRHTVQYSIIDEEWPETKAHLAKLIEESAAVEIKTPE